MVDFSPGTDIFALIQVKPAHEFIPNWGSRTEGSLRDGPATNEIEQWPTFDPDADGGCLISYDARHDSRRTRIPRDGVWRGQMCWH
jgi:hypothetical protein